MEQWVDTQEELRRPPEVKRQSQKSEDSTMFTVSTSEKNVALSKINNFRATQDVPQIISSHPYVYIRKLSSQIKRNSAQLSQRPKNSAYFYQPGKKVS